ncbi:MAG: peptidoglycan editing factor PgeF [Sulfurospirillum sp.]
MRYIFSDRFGGVSKPPFESLNLALHVEDDFFAVVKNRAVLAKKLGTQNLVFMEQVHRSNVEIITKKKSQTVSQTDALVTNIKGVALCVMVADCIPVLFYDKLKGVVAVAHAGRNGVKEKIANKTIQKMQDKFFSKVEDIMIYIGPSIKSCCYEVKDDATKGFENYLHSEGEKIYLDIVSKCINDMKSMGIIGRNIKLSPICTCCDKNYFSYRRDGETGRFCGGIVL